MPFDPSKIPTDVIPCIVQSLPLCKDLYRCALVNRVFYEAAIPVLYRTLDTRVPTVRREGGQVQVLHPYDTIRQKPWYGQYVRYILDCARHNSQEKLAALRLCCNLRSFSWTDSYSSEDADAMFCAYLDVLQDIGIDELHVKVSSGISDHMWTRLTRFRGVSSLGVVSSQVPASDLSAWASRVGPSLRALDFSISSEAGHNPQFLRHMLHLRSLRLDAPTSSILDVLASLPHLTTLDVRYRTSGATNALSGSPLTRLQHLTIHVIQDGAAGLWEWVLNLVPHPNSLQTLTVHNRVPRGEAIVPSSFVRRLAQMHGDSVRQLFLYNLAVEPDGAYVLFTAFRQLEAMSFIHHEWNLLDISNVVHSALNLRTLMIQYSRPASNDVRDLIKLAEQWMDRDRGSTLTWISFGSEIFKGRWMYDTRHRRPVFEVYRDMNVRSRWI